MFTHDIIRKAHVACNFYCIFEAKELLKIIDSQVHRTSDIISETMQENIKVRWSLTAEPTFENNKLQYKRAKWLETRCLITYRPIIKRAQFRRC